MGWNTKETQASWRGILSCCIAAAFFTLFGGTVLAQTPLRDSYTPDTSTPGNPSPEELAELEQYLRNATAPEDRNTETRRDYTDRSDPRHTENREVVAGSADSRRSVSEDNATRASRYDTGANWTVTGVSGKNWYRVFFDWAEIDDSTGYALRLSKLPGQDPGVLVTTTRSDWTFPGVSAGTWYVNMKSQDKTGAWTPIYYWEVSVPQEDTSNQESNDVHGTSTNLNRKIPETETGNYLDMTSQTDIKSGDESDSELLHLRNALEEILKRLDLTRYINPQPSLVPEEYSNASEFAPGSNVDSGIDSLIQSFEEDTNNVSENTGADTVKTSFTCDCTRSCSDLPNCNEAYYMLNSCGCANLDPNGDGVPCGTRCAQ